LRLLGGVGVPAEPPSGLDLVHDRRRLGRAVSTAGGERTRPTHRRITLATDLDAFQLIGLDDRTLGALLVDLRRHRCSPLDEME
jgi:hypothetical protein